MKNKILYFGYGACRSAEVMESITGNGRIQGRPATLNNFELCVQRFDQIPDVVSPNAPVKLSPRSLVELSWKEPEKFESYVVRPSNGSQVQGIIWELTEQEHLLMKNWELTEFGWHKAKTLFVVTKFEGSAFQVHTTVLGDDQEVDRVVEGVDYPLFLNDSGEYFTIAGKTRKEFLEIQNQADEGDKPSKRESLR